MKRTVFTTAAVAASVMQLVLAAPSHGADSTSSAAARAELQVSGADVFSAQAVDCVNDQRGDPDEGKAIDVGQYLLSVDCSDGMVVFAIGTYDTWLTSDLHSLDVFLDIDNNASTGCNGFEYAAGIVDGVGRSTILPTCDTSTWINDYNGLQFLHSAPNTAGMAFTIPALVNYSGTIRWFGAATSMYTSTDFLPDVGSNFSTVVAPTPPPPPPPPVPAVCQFNSWRDAQIAYEKDPAAKVTINAAGVVCPDLPGAPVSTPIASTGAGYTMVEATGTVFGFGDMLPIGAPAPSNAVSIASGPNGGYWILGSDGTVSARAANHYGNVQASQLSKGERPTTIAGLADGSGYWVFTNKGKVLNFGQAKNFGDMSGGVLNGEIVASATTPTGLGYWMVGSDGGIFAFGDAQFYGSTGDLKLNKPVVGIAPDPDGVGYWLVASDGGIFAFSADFRGSTGNLNLNKPVIGALAYGDGYLMVASDGGIFSFSSKPFLGSLGGNPPPSSIVGVAIRR